MEFPVGSLVRDTRNFADDADYWVTTSLPERGVTCTFVYVKTVDGKRRSKRNIKFLTHLDNE